MLTTPHIHKSHSLFKEDLADLHRFDRIQNAKNRLTLIYPTIKYTHGFVIIFQLMNPKFTHQYITHAKTRKHTLHRKT